MNYYRTISVHDFINLLHEKHKQNADRIQNNSRAYRQMTQSISQEDGSRLGKLDLLNQNNDLSNENKDLTNLHTLLLEFYRKLGLTLIKEMHNNESSELQETEEVNEISIKELEGLLQTKISEEEFEECDSILNEIERKKVESRS